MTQLHHYILPAVFVSLWITPNLLSKRVEKLDEISIEAIYLASAAPNHTS